MKNGDIITDNLGRGKIEYVEKYLSHRVRYEDGSLKWLVDYTDAELKSIEVKYAK